MGRCPSGVAYAVFCATRTPSRDQRGYSPGARPPEPESYEPTALVSDVLAVPGMLFAAEHVTLVDVSPEVLALASRNAAPFGDRVDAQVVDLRAPLPPAR